MDKRILITSLQRTSTPSRTEQKHSLSLQAVEPKQAPDGWVTCGSCTPFPYRFLYVTHERWPFQVSVVKRSLLKYLKYSLGTVHHPLRPKISRTTQATSVTVPETPYSEKRTDDSVIRTSYQVKQSICSCEQQGTYARPYEIYLFYTLSVQN